MPLLYSKSKPAFKHNVEAEVHAGKPLKQALAIAYNARKHAKKMSTGGKVTAIEHESYEKQAHDKPMSEPEEPMTHERPAHEDMGRNMDRVRAAVRMAMGGMVEDADRKLAMKDSYPEGAAESDTEAQDEGFGNYQPPEGEMGDEDQEKARKMAARMSRALGR